MIEDRIDLVGYASKTVVLKKDVESVLLHNIRGGAEIEAYLRREDEQDDIFIEKIQLAMCLESQAKMLIDVERQNVVMRVNHVEGSGVALHEVFTNAVLRLTMGGEWNLREDDEIVIVLTGLGSITSDSYIEPIEGFGVAKSLVRYKKYNFNLAKGMKTLDVSSLKYLVFQAWDGKQPEKIEMWRQKQRKIISKDNLTAFNEANYGLVIIEYGDGDSVNVHGTYNSLLVDVRSLDLLNLTDSINTGDYNFHGIL
jgi:hypothetical protein